MQNNILQKRVTKCRFLFVLVVCIICSLNLNAQSATSTTPVSIGRPCGSGAGITDSIMYFNFNSATSTISRLSSCRPILASPGLSSNASSVSFNPADGNLYVESYKTSGGTASYVWRWSPGMCPTDTLPVYKTYPGKMILGLEFDASGIGYQINFTGSSPFGLELQRFDFATNTFGQSISIDMQGKKVYTQNGDFVITSTGQFLMVWDNKYFSLNYQDYNTSTPLVATYIDTLTLASGGKMVGLSYAQGKLVGSATGGCAYYSFNILTGALTPITKGAGSQFSTDMTNITSGIGTAKELVSATPVRSGVYDLVYDITVKNFGDYPISDLQVAEDLTTVHTLGALAISRVSTQWVKNPAGLTLNSSFNGTTDKNLLSTSQTLPNYPTSSNYCVIRVKFRLSSVLTGTVYYNSAVVTGNGYNSIPLKDSSTNGAEPDLNNNNKPDDTGENQPTPFFVATTSEFPPCSSISNILYTQDFGTGATISTTLPGTTSTEYAAGSNPLNEETYVLTNNAKNGNSSKYVNLNDHTGNTNGRMLLINGDVQNYKVFEDVVSVPCINVKYSFLIYAANATNSTYNSFCTAFGGIIYPQFTFVVRNALTNSIITTFTTDDISDTTWKAYGLKWVMPAGVTSVKLQIYNSAEGGCGNAFAIDDVQFGICDALPTISTLPSAGCMGLFTTINAALSDTTNMGGNLQYQWQTSSTGTSGWVSILGASSSDYSINSFGVADQKFYRIIVAPSGNLGTTCQYVSNNIYLSAKDSSTSPSEALSDKNFLCPGQSAVLNVSGGSLGTNAVWKWYKASCGGDYENTGSEVTVYPTGVGTTYYVRAEGDCNVTNCVWVNVPLTCVLAEEAINLKGSAANQQVNLSWTVVSDAKLNYMEVERSTDGSHFKAIQKIVVNGFANKSGYTAQDNIAMLANNNVFYRIKVIRADAQGLYSKVLNLSIKTNAFNATVSPNPASTKAKIEFYMSSSSAVAIKLFNSQGQLLQSSNVAAESGYNSYTIPNVDKLKGGMYFISIGDANSTSHLKLIVQ